MRCVESSVHVAAHKEASAFLNALLLQLDGEEPRRLADRLAKTVREERCLRHAVFLMVVLLMIFLVGLGYCAILLPEAFGNLDHFLMRGLSLLGLWSVISLVTFLGYLLWRRIAVTRLHEECRRLILALGRPQCAGSAALPFAVHVGARSPLNNRQKPLSVPEPQRPQLPVPQAGATHRPLAAPDSSLRPETRIGHGLCHQDAIRRGSATLPAGAKNE